MLARTLVFALLGTALIPSHTEATDGTGPSTKPTLKKQPAKTNLAKQRLCPQNLDEDIVANFAEGYPETANDPHNVYVKEGKRIRSALPHDSNTRKKIKQEQEEKGGIWALTDESLLSGLKSSVCTYTNASLGNDVNTIKVSVYIE